MGGVSCRKRREDGLGMRWERGRERELLKPGTVFAIRQVKSIVDPDSTNHSRVSGVVDDCFPVTQNGSHK